MIRLFDNFFIHFLGGVCVCVKASPSTALPLSKMESAFYLGAEEVLKNILILINSYTSIHEIELFLGKKRS